MFALHFIVCHFAHYLQNVTLHILVAIQLQAAKLLFYGSYYTPELRWAVMSVVDFHGAHNLLYQRQTHHQCSN